MYTAIIVEPRQHKALFFVLNNFLENLSNEWNIIVFHGKQNHGYLNNIINNNLLQYKNRITLIKMNVDNLTINDYNKIFITNVHFYDKIPTETFLVFQTDSMIFKNNKHLIDNFLKFDYAGAPWSDNIFDKYNVGNGGLSLRKKSKMLEIIEKSKKYLQNVNEDIFFSCNDIVPLYKPTFEEAKLFSIELVYSDISFGCHKPWGSPDYNKIVEVYPEVKILKELCESLNEPQKKKYSQKQCLIFH
jgi:hypothetical protein